MERISGEVATLESYTDIYRTDLNNVSVPGACPRILTIQPEEKLIKTTLFLSVSIDGLISDKNGIPLFLKDAGVKEAIIGGGRAVAYSFMREKLVEAR